MELEGQIESQLTEGRRNCFQRNITTLLVYKCHGVGWNRFRADKLFRDFLQSLCFIEGKKSEPGEAEVTYKSSPSSGYCQGKNSGVCCGRSWASQGEPGQSSETVTTTFEHNLWARHHAQCCRCFGHWIPAALNDRCYPLSPSLPSWTWDRRVAEKSPFKRIQCSLVTILKFIIIFEKGTPHFNFILSPTNYVTGSHYLHIIYVSAKA